MKKSKLSKRKGRLREFLILLLKKYDVRCYFCGEPITEEDLPPRGGDKLTIHHLNGNRDDNSVENLVLVHRRCHKAYHLRQTKNKAKEGSNGEEKRRKEVQGVGRAQG